MLSEKMEKALNDQINAEFYSAYLYLSMSAYFEELDYPGFAQWMKVQSKEEEDHGAKLYEYVIARGNSVTLEAIEKPQEKWDSVEAIFEHVLEHEQLVTSLINDLVDLAISEKDHATNQFLQWYVAEQVEEEENARDNLGKIKRAGNSQDLLFLLDAELGGRKEGA